MEYWHNFIYFVVINRDSLGPMRHHRAMEDADLKRVAVRVLAQYGTRANQYVIEQIILAIRDYDLPKAQRWNKVGAIIEKA